MLSLASSPTLSHPSPPPLPPPLPPPPPPRPPLLHLLTLDDSALLLHFPTASLTSALPLTCLASLPPTSALRWYTKFHLKSLLSLMGVKPRHMHRILQGAYHSFTSLLPPSPPTPPHSTPPPPCPIIVPLLLGPTPFPPPPSSLVLPSSLFLSILTSALPLSKHFHPTTSPPLLSFSLSLLTRRSLCLVFLTGASGTGKSTLASLLADRLRVVERVIGTDGVRHVLRAKLGGEVGVMGVSTYRAWEWVGEGVDPAMLLEEWKEPQAEGKGMGEGGERAEEEERKAGEEKVEGEEEPQRPALRGEGLSHATRVRLGYHLQSAVICSHLHALVRSLIATRTSAIIEGVHLLPSFLSHLISRYSSPHVLLLPFLVYISNETKHRERFAVRSSTSSPPSLSPPINPYIAHFPSIRIIQKHLLTHPTSSTFPSIDNTNVDRSVAAVHEIALKIMARAGGAGGGEGGGMVVGVGGEVVREVEGMRREAWGGKAMQRLLRMKVEKRHLFERLREAERERREREEGAASEQQQRMGMEGEDEEESGWRLSEKLERLFPSPKEAAAPQPSTAPDAPLSFSPAVTSPSTSIPIPSASAEAGRVAVGAVGKAGRSMSAAIALTSPFHSALSPSNPTRPSARVSGKVSPSSPLLSSSLGTPPPFLHHLPSPHLSRRSSSPLPLPSPEASSVRFTVSDDDGPGAGGGRSESEGEGEGGAGSVVWSMGGGSLMAASVDEDEEEGTGGEDGEEEGGEREEEGGGEGGAGVRGIGRIDESEDGFEEGEQGMDAGAGSDSESGVSGSRGRLDTDEDGEGGSVGYGESAQQSHLRVQHPPHQQQPHPVVRDVEGGRKMSAEDGPFTVGKRVVLY